MLGDALAGTHLAEIPVGSLSRQPQVAVAASGMPIGDGKCGHDTKPAIRQRAHVELSPHGHGTLTQTQESLPG